MVAEIFQLNQPIVVTKKLVKEIGKDEKIALAGVQALVDILINKKIIENDDFFNAINARLKDIIGP